MDKKRSATLFLIVLADMSGAAAIIPIIPVYVLAQFHATPFQATLVIATYYAAQVLAAPWLGHLSDHFGRRPILLLSQVGTIVSYLLIVFAAPLGVLLDHVGLQPGIAAGLVVIYLARILDGVTGGNISVAQAYASDISTPEERTRALGLVGGAGGLGHILGPALAAVIAPITLLAPFLAASVVSAITLLLTLLWLPEPLTRPQQWDRGTEQAEGLPLSEVLLRRPVVLILLAALVIGLYLAALFGTFALYADRVLFPGQPEAQVVRAVGLIITVLGLVTALTQVVLLKPLVSRLGEPRAVLLGSLLLLGSAVGLFAVSALGAVMVFVVAYALGYGISWPTLQALLTRLGSEQMAGRMLGWFQSVFSLALILGPVWGGALFDAVGPQAIFAVSAGLMVLALLLSVAMQGLPQARKSGTSAQSSPETKATTNESRGSVPRSFGH
jgi:MFS transporter, DHA1 family, tetracycline resistance protein